MKTSDSNNSSSEIKKISKITPDEKTMRIILANAKKKPLKQNLIIIARYDWLKRNKLQIPAQMELPNLFLKIKDGKLIHTYYTNVLTHMIKKQRYFIQILN